MKSSKNLIDYIVLTEFDINTGSVVRVMHPTPKSTTMRPPFAAN